MSHDEPQPQSPSVVARADHLSVGFGENEVVHDISLTVHAGQCVAIVGESGSGKSVTARTLLGLNGENSWTEASALALGDHDLKQTEPKQWRALRGSEVGYVLQDALVSLDPLRRVGAQVADSLRVHGRESASAREAQVISLLESVGVPEPELRARQLPTELSGGLRQRALIAAAIALNPPLLIADEPTTALDTTVQAQILELLGGLRAAGTGLLLISHDLAVVGRIADHVVVMEQGRIVEQGPTEQVLQDPQHPYTRRLLDAVPASHAPGTRLSDLPPASLPPRGERAGTSAGPSAATDGTPLLQVEHVTKRYKGPDGRTRTVVDDVSFELHAGETLGIVGESGSGKTTTAAMALANLTPNAGRVLFEGGAWSEAPERVRRARRPRISTVAQDPLSSFDPRLTVSALIVSALKASDKIARRRRSRSALLTRVDELLGGVGLDATFRDRAPVSLSGGQRQRVAIARALATGPDVLVLDEAVSALDVSVQAQVLDLLADIRAAYGTAALFISHDLGVIRHSTDRVLVLKDGRVVEQGPTDQVFTDPQAEYTKLLLSAVPGLSLTSDLGLEPAT
jgi:peptide/nickel transport system ATP-binding protein